MEECGGTLFFKLTGVTLDQLPLLSDIKLTGKTLDLLLIIVLLWLLANHWLNSVTDNLLNLMDRIEHTRTSVDEIHQQTQSTEEELKLLSANEQIKVPEAYQKRVDAIIRRNAEMRLTLDEQFAAIQRQEDQANKLLWLLIDNSIRTVHIIIPLITGFAAIILLAFNIGFNIFS